MTLFEKICDNKDAVIFVKGKIMQRYDIGMAIGNTPLVELRKVNPNPRVRILAKLEGNNPGGSVKDRPAWFMLSGTEERGDLTHDRVILESKAVSQLIWFWRCRKKGEKTFFVRSPKGPGMIKFSECPFLLLCRGVTKFCSIPFWVPAFLVCLP